MNEKLKASLESQIGNEPCPIHDTEEIFWLREADDCESRFRLANALAAQYRFREAIIAYENAIQIRKDDWRLFYSLGGSYLTIRQFGKAVAAYNHCLELGAKEETVSYTLGVAHYLQNDFAAAASAFAKALPCGDEMAIAVIYWHTLSCYRAKCEPTLLSLYHKDMQAGHHTAYKLAVSAFCGEISREQFIFEIENEKDKLNYIIAAYGLCTFLESIKEKALARQYISALLTRVSVWPSIPYLAAWNDINAGF